jgi:hypothetical protein
MGYVQAITPTPSIPCRPGWCLEYVRKAFDQPARYGSATEAWDASPAQHHGRDFPAAWVPVHYAVAGVPEGHIVLRAPDGSVYSTTDPVALTPVHHPDLADLEARYAGAGLPLTYRGWTEDIAGTPVVQYSALAAQGTTTPKAEGKFMAETDFINKDQAEDIAKRAAVLVLAGIGPLLDKKLRVNVNQAEDIAQRAAALIREGK